MNVRFLACQTRKAICNVSLARLWTQEQTFAFTVRSPIVIVSITKFFKNGLILNSPYYC